MLMPRAGVGLAARPGTGVAPVPLRARCDFEQCFTVQDDLVAHMADGGHGDSVPGSVDMLDRDAGVDGIAGPHRGAEIQLLAYVYGGSRAGQTIGQGG